MGLKPHALRGYAVEIGRERLPVSIAAHDVAGVVVGNEKKQVGAAAGLSAADDGRAEPASKQAPGEHGMIIIGE